MNWLEEKWLHDAGMMDPVQEAKYKRKQAYARLEERLKDINTHINKRDAINFILDNENPNMSDDSLIELVLDLMYCENEFCDNVERSNDLEYTEYHEASVCCHCRTNN